MKYLTATLTALVATLVIGISPVAAEPDCGSFIDLSGPRLLNDGVSTHGPVIPATLQAGDYAVVFNTSDVTHETHDNASQTDESLTLVLSDGTVIGPTVDIADDATTASTAFTVTISDVMSVQVVHAQIGFSVNSVDPVSVCFERFPDPEPEVTPEPEPEPTPEPDPEPEPEPIIVDPVTPEPDPEPITSDPQTPEPEIGTPETIQAPTPEPDVIPADPTEAPELALTGPTDTAFLAIIGTMFMAGGVAYDRKIAPKFQ